MGVSSFSFAWTSFKRQVQVLSHKKVDSETHFAHIEHSCGLAGVYRIVRYVIHKTDSG